MMSFWELSLRTSRREKISSYLRRGGLKRGDGTGGVQTEVFILLS